MREIGSLHIRILQTELENRVNMQRLREIEEQRAVEFQEAQRLKNLIKFQSENVGTPEYVDERDRFFAHKNIANSFRKVIPAKPRISESVVMGLSGSRFKDRPEPFDAV